MTKNLDKFPNPYPEAPSSVQAGEFIGHALVAQDAIVAGVGDYPTNADDFRLRFSKLGETKHDWGGNDPEAYGGVAVRIVGEDEINYIDYLRQDPDETQVEQKIKKELDGAQEFLLTTLKPEVQERTGIRTSHKADIILADAKLAGMEIPEGDDPIENARQVISALSDDTKVELFLRAHVQAEKERLVQQLDRLEQSKQNFLQLAGQAIDEGRIPGLTDIELIRRRVNSLKLQVIDPLSAPGPGFYDHYEHVLTVTSTEVDRDGYLVTESGRQAPVSQFHVFSHEGMHGSGAKVLMAEEGEEIKVGVLRSGLFFRNIGDIKKNVGSGGRFVIFEEAAMRIQGVTESVCRVGERKFLKLFRTTGDQEMSEDLFFEAKFEEYDPSQPPSKRGLGWKKLWRAINEAHGRGFMVELDNMIEAYAEHNYSDAVEQASNFLKSISHNSDSGNSYEQLVGLRQQKAHELGLPATARWVDILEKENLSSAEAA